MYILLNVLAPKGLEFVLIMINLSDWGSCKKTFLIPTRLNNMRQHMDVWTLVSPTCSVLHLKSTQHSEPKLCIVMDLVRC